MLCNPSVIPGVWRTSKGSVPYLATDKHTKTCQCVPMMIWEPLFPRAYSLRKLIPYRHIWGLVFNLSSNRAKYLHILFMSLYQTPACGWINLSWMHVYAATSQKHQTKPGFIKIAYYPVVTDSNGTGPRMQRQIISFHESTSMTYLHWSLHKPPFILFVMPLINYPCM